LMRLHSAGEPRRENIHVRPEFLREPLQVAR
jgi:hypothetical protein